MARVILNLEACGKHCSAGVCTSPFEVRPGSGQLTFAVNFKVRESRILLKPVFFPFICLLSVG